MLVASEKIIKSCCQNVIRKESEEWEKWTKLPLTFEGRCQKIQTERSCCKWSLSAPVLIIIKTLTVSTLALRYVHNKLYKRKRELLNLGPRLPPLSPYPNLSFFVDSDNVLEISLILRMSIKGYFSN